MRCALCHTIQHSRRRHRPRLPLNDGDDNGLPGFSQHFPGLGGGKKLSIQQQKRGTLRRKEIFKQQPNHEYASAWAAFFCVCKKKKKGLHVCSTRPGGTFCSRHTQTHVWLLGRKNMRAEQPTKCRNCGNLPSIKGFMIMSLLLFSCFLIYSVARWQARALQSRA